MGEKPTTTPTRSPTKKPTNNPTKAPIGPPSPSPSAAPSRRPTKNPTGSPTKIPTVSPTKNPTGTPTASPTPFPTIPNCDFFNFTQLLNAGGSGLTLLNGLFIVANEFGVGQAAGEPTPAATGNYDAADEFTRFNSGPVAKVDNNGLTWRNFRAVEIKFVPPGRLTNLRVGDVDGGPTGVSDILGFSHLITPTPV